MQCRRHVPCLAIGRMRSVRVLAKRCLVTLMFSTHRCTGPGTRTLRARALVGCQLNSRLKVRLPPISIRLLGCRIYGVGKAQLRCLVANA
jgi:hypothetical protein